MNIIKILFTILFLGALAGCNPRTEDVYTQKNIEDAITEKADRIGYYLKAADLAESNGYSEAALYLKDTAENEIEQLKQLSKANVSVGGNTQRVIEKLMKAEKQYYLHTYPEMSRIAMEEERDEIAEIFENAAVEEKIHYNGLKGIYNKLEQ